MPNEPNNPLSVLEKMKLVKRVDNGQQQNETTEFEFVDDTENLEPQEEQPQPEQQPFNDTYIPQNSQPYGIPQEDLNMLSEDKQATITDKYSSIEELYNYFRMPLGGTNTVYLLESYMKIMPETLPAELRRSMILDVVATSGFSFQGLFDDGVDRLAKLNEFSSLYAERTKEEIDRNNIEIDALERQIEELRSIINSRKNLHKQQGVVLDAESQRVRKVLDFLTQGQ